MPGGWTLRFRPLASLLTAVVLLGLLPAATFANDAALYFGSDPELLWVEWGLIQNGEAPPTSIYPVAGSELETRFQVESGDPAAAAENRFGFVLRPVYGTYSFPLVTPISRVGETLDPVSSSFYWSQPPYLEVRDDLSVGDWFNLHIHVDQRMDAGKLPRTPGTLLNTYMFESSAPREGYLTAASSHFRLTAGRLQSGVGHGFFGNTFLNGKANYYDQIQLTAFSGNFKYFYMFGTSDPLLTDAEQAIQVSPLDFPTYAQPYKSYAYKRIEYQPLPNLVLGAGEANMIGGIKPDFQNISPVGIWHNTYGYGYKNVLASVDASWVPFNGLHLFGEFTMDDLKLKREAGSRKPNALAWQLGARYVLPDLGEIRHMAGVEYTHVDPWAYNTFQPYLMYYQRQAYASSTNDWYMDVPMGYAYGPDCDQFGVYYRAVTRTGLQATLSYSHLVQGEAELAPYDEDPTTTWYDMNDKIPLTNGHVGIAETYNIAGLSVHYPVWIGFSVVANGNFAWVQNYGHITGAKGLVYIWGAGVEYAF